MSGPRPCIRGRRRSRRAWAATATSLPWPRPRGSSSPRAANGPSSSCMASLIRIAQPKGRTNQAMASWIDVAPTILDWTQTKGPAGYKLPGRSLLPILAEDNPQGWDAVYASHQFHEITMYYPMRSIRTRTHSYILNLAHELEYPFASDLWGSRTWQGVLARNDPMLGKLRVADYLHRPREELYDLTKDPHELVNVAGDAAY